MPKGVYDRSHIIPWNKGLKGYRAGVRHSEETKAKIAKSHTGKRHSEETKQKLSKHFKGRPISEQTRLKIQATMRAKFEGLTPNLERERVRRIRRSTEYANWRVQILEKYGYTCVLCGEEDRSKLTVDHIKPVRLFPELATDLNNGRVLCNLCHLRVPTHGAFSRA